MIFDKHAILKYGFGNWQLWAAGYYVSRAGRQKAIYKEIGAIRYHDG